MRRKSFTVLKALQSLHKKKGIKTLLPSILIEVDEKTILRENSRMRSKKVHHINFYEEFYIEVSSSKGPQGFDCSFDPETYSVAVSVYRSDGSPISSFRQQVDEEGLETTFLLSTDDKERLSFIMFILHLIGEARDTKTSIFTGTRNKGSIYYREENTVKFKRIYDVKKLPSPEYEPPEPGSSGIKKRDHQVKGHYRTYKSGVKVWVKPHRRGDPALGSVTSVFT